MSFPNKLASLIPSLKAPLKSDLVLCRRNIKLVGEISGYALSSNVVIAIPLHNQKNTLREALISALSQKLSNGHVSVILLDDQSTDAWIEEVSDLITNPGLIILNACCGSPAQSRNAILDFVETEMPNIQWIARLDPDDKLTSTWSVNALLTAGDAKDASFVIGSNHISVNGKQVLPSNIADADTLQNLDKLTHFIQSFCQNQARHELPSCNLLIKANRGIRYPIVRSAEDHWLVSQLLTFRASESAIVPYPVYSTYSLRGKTTSTNLKLGEHRKSREQLSNACKVWANAIKTSDEILGYGMEGCVYKRGSKVIKDFYPEIMNADDISKVAQLTVKSNGRIPSFNWFVNHNQTVSCSYDWFETEKLSGVISTIEIKAFLIDLAIAGIVTCNIKRDNLRLRNGHLIYIDIGKDIQPFEPSAFLDCAARLYALGVLCFPDGELSRRQCQLKQHEALSSLDGFEEFYKDLIVALHPLVKVAEKDELPLSVAKEVTLLIKSCPQDYELLIEQVGHIVSQLSSPHKFAQVILLIDPFVGKYLRQYNDGCLELLLENAIQLKHIGLIDEVWVAPEFKNLIESTYAKWFSISDIHETHTASGAPLFSQIWAFERITTKYVLQADVDVLIGRKDKNHDYLNEMLDAIMQTNVWCVGFNIPQLESGFQQYTSSLHGYVPEIRLGLLDLDKLKSNLPIPNDVDGNRLVYMWHRSMQLKQNCTSLQSVRGGDDKTFYIHPQNHIKKNKQGLINIRDLVGQGIYPHCQAKQWDLIYDTDWSYPTRSENIVFLLKGRNTPAEKLERCISSLEAQTDQDFGVILIDDASEICYSWHIDLYLKSLRNRTSLIRHREHKGYIPNFLLASHLCTNSETMIVVLDQDDVLMNANVVSALKEVIATGADLINGLMFRPNKPTRLYFADYVAPRSKGGGNTWTHLRAFKKKLFESVPIDEFKLNGEWISDVTDYATMLPMVEFAKTPVQLKDQYYVWHERLEYSSERKNVQSQLIEILLSRNYLI